MPFGGLPLLVPQGTAGREAEHTQSSNGWYDGASAVSGARTAGTACCGTAKLNEYCGKWISHLARAAWDTLVGEAQPCFFASADCLSIILTLEA